MEIGDISKYVKYKLCYKIREKFINVQTLVLTIFGLTSNVHILIFVVLQTR